MRNSFLNVVLVGLIFAAGTRSRLQPQEPQFPPSDMATGADMYKQACASCHGGDAKGHGPAAIALKTPPADLTTLAKRHNGKFPYDYVSAVLLVGPNLPAHGSTDMPVWGPIFKFIDKNNKQLVMRRIQDLSDYLASLQTK